MVPHAALVQFRETAQGKPKDTAPRAAAIRNSVDWIDQTLSSTKTAS